MAKVEVTAQELVDADVQFISLVKRGANRIPFRICKKDESDMINLSGIFRKQEAPSPSVISAVVRKGADLEEQKDRLSKLGLSVEKMEEVEGGYLFKQDDAKGVDETVLKVDEDLALVVTGITKAFDDLNLESSSFAEVFATEAYRPSVGMALSMLDNTVQNIMQKADSPNDASDRIAKAVDEFKAYVVGLTSAIPTTAFKADVTKGEKPQATAGGDQSGVEKGEDEAVAKSEKAPASEEGKSDSQETTQKSDEGADAKGADAEDTAKSEEGEGSEAQKSEEAEAGKGAEGTQKADTGDVTDKVEALLAGLQKSVDAQFDKLAARVEELSKRADAVEAQAKKAEEAVSGTVDMVHKADGQSQSGGQSEGVPPLLDTAYNRPA
jgi:hypothetical protein